jgi:lipoprotein-releasing system permease protein
MNKISWIIHVAKRYFLTKRKEKGHTASILSIMGIAVGVMTLITVIAVMNGFQQGFITNINEIRSFHIRINSGKVLAEEQEEEILNVKGVNAVTPFADIQTIIRGLFDDQKGAAVRAVDEDILLKDKGLAEKLTISKGAFDLKGRGSIVLGSDLARSLGVRPGDPVMLLSLAGKGYEKLSPINIEFIVTGIFNSGYYEINSTMAFISLNDAELFVPVSDYVYGIKLDNHYRDREALSKLGEIDSLRYLSLESWRNYNRSFFSALLMEKMMMMVLISLIFVVVAVNIFHSMKRSVVERIEEIALMKAVGATAFSIQSVFILEGAIIGVLGSSLGAVLGYLISYNINGIFDLVEKIINFFTSFLAGITGQAGPINDFNIYSGSSYFLQEVPIEIMTGDVVYITSMALFSALAAAWYASRGVATIKPAAVLRYE